MFICNCFSIIFLQFVSDFCNFMLYDLTTMSAIFLPIKSLIAFGDFSISFFEVVLSASVADCLA